MERERVAQLVRQNDDASRRELFEIFYRRTYAAVFAILRHRESAEDITQDAFIKAFQNITRLREKEKFGLWLAAIATNLARNHLKREKRLYYSGNPVEPEAGSAQITPQQHRRAGHPRRRNSPGPCGPAHSSSRAVPGGDHAVFL